MKTSKSALSEKAVELFREKGYENVSVSMVCKACGVTSGSFYHHFSTKEDLLSYYLNAEVAHHFDLTFVDILDIEDPKERLWTVLEDITQYWLMFGHQLGKQLWASVVEATHVYGAPGATEDTPFELPTEPESFEEFLRGKISSNEEGYSFAWLEKSEYRNLVG